MLYIWITKAYYYEIRGRKTHWRDKLYIRGGEGEGRVVANCKSKDRGRMININDDKKGNKKPLKRYDRIAKLQHNWKRSTEKKT